MKLRHSEVALILGVIALVSAHWLFARVHFVVDGTPVLTHPLRLHGGRQDGRLGRR
jgi:hypothetical protein